MSGATAGASAAAAAAAAARKRRMEEEEESMTRYDKNDLDGWEFKIMRSALGSFKNYEAVRKLCEEEAQNGWELVEKFDEHRIRFKRPIERRANDHMATIDPYRTNRGLGSSGRTAIFIGLFTLLAGLAILTFFLVERS